jgi:hypothetical protein
MVEENGTPMMRAARYREEAKAVRALAGQSPTPDIKRQLLEVAGRYERLAERAEKGKPEG